MALTAAVPVWLITAPLTPEKSLLPGSTALPISGLDPVWMLTARMHVNVLSLILGNVFAE